MPTTTPPSEVPITRDLVLHLLDDQYPTTVPLQPRRVAEGWDNVTWRLNHDLAMRVPRRAAAVPCLLNEQRWLRHVAAELPVSVPMPVFKGRPTERYPWPWSIVQWVPGSLACEPVQSNEGTLSPEGAAQLGRLLRAIHQPAPNDAPRNPYRGVPLSNRRADFEQRLDDLRKAALASAAASSRTLRHLVSDDTIGRIYKAAEASRWSDPAVWLHGDLHPKNVLIRSGCVVGLIDWGDICCGDPASDLACLWMLLPRGLHADCLNGYGTPSDQHLWARAKAWAVHFAVLFALAGLEGDEAFLRIGCCTLRRALHTPR